MCVTITARVCSEYCTCVAITARLFYNICTCMYRLLYVFGTITVHVCSDYTNFFIGITAISIIRVKLGKN